jgi:hypothetical protein
VLIILIRGLSFYLAVANAFAPCGLRFMTHKPLQGCLWAVYVALRLKSQLVCLGAVSPSLGSRHSSPVTRHSLMLRRDFLSLCGLAAGSCLVPDAIARVIRDTCILAREPYLILPRNPKDTLYAYSGDGKTDFMLHIGDPTIQETAPTWREYFEEYEFIDIKDKDAVRDWWMMHVGDPDEDPITIEADAEIDGAAYEQWEWRQELHDGPSARAFHHLSELPLDDGSRLVGGEALGKLRFIEGDRPGSNLTYVEAPDLATLACLQNRLNELGQSFAIEIREW